MADQQRDIEQIFHEARQIRDRGERDAYLTKACAGDEGRRARVERLLAAEDELGSFMRGDETYETPGHAGEGAASAATVAPSPLSEKPGTVIGRYKLLQQIGEGGFGVVYMAEQEEPVRRKVALKIIKLGMDTRQVIARFEAERQALAMMDHPHIAKVLDAGATETGRPYFVMELVRGLPITEYCDKENVSLRERLSLFITVCSAVQHAHQKGIIHRDLKPSNILVTLHDGKPVPKVIDFGIAKATEQRLTERTMFTEFGQFMGTPAYMSPEQAELSGLDIDSRSDIYSLGVLLYELLTGATPFDMRTLRGAALDEIRRIIREDEPSKPSTRISTVREDLDTVAKRRGVEPRKLGTILRGDLDWIVMKALEKDRQRRYETANGLGKDIQRYLTGEAVEAAPPSAPYRLKKLVRRNKGVVTAGALLAAALVVGVIGTTWGMVWALDEKERADTAATAERAAQAQAQERADALEEVAKFQAEQLSGIDVPLMGLRLRESLLEKVRAAAERSRLAPHEVDARLKETQELMADIDLTGLATEMLDANIFQRALTAINTQFAVQPLVRARLLQTVADSLVGVGLLEQANAPQDEALKIRRTALGDDHPDALASISASAILHGKQGKFDEAKPLFEEAIERRRRTLGNEHPETLTSIFAMGTLLYFQGQYSQAEPYFRESLEGRKRVLVDGHPDTLQSIRNLGSLRVAQGKLAEAETLHREALDASRRTLGADHPDTLMSMTALCGTLKWQGKYAEGEELDRAIVDGRRRQLGDNHPDTLNAASSLGETLRNLKKFTEAEALLRDVTDRQRRLLGSDHPDTLVSISRLGLLLSDLARYEEAEPYYREALDGRRRRLGSDHANTLASLNNMGFLLQRMGRFADAEVNYREALEARRRTSGPEHPATLSVLFNIGRLQFAQDKFAEAEVTFRDVLERRRRAVGDDHPDTQNTLQALGVLLKKTGGHPEAERVLRECHQLRLRALPPGDPRIYEALSLLGDAVAKQGRFADAEPMLMEAYEKLVQPASVELRRDAAQRVADLHVAWHAAEPNAGHDAEAAQWMAKAEEMKK